MPPKKLSVLKKKRIKRRIPVAPPARTHLDRKAQQKAVPSGRKLKHKVSDLE